MPIMLRLATPGLRQPLLKPTLLLTPLACQRSCFSSTVQTLIIYKSHPKIVKHEPNKTLLKPLSESTMSEIEDRYKDKKLLKNKYYRNTPKFLKPYMRSLMLRPSQFVVSFAILHEISGLLPFVMLWWLLVKYDWLMTTIGSFEYSQDLFNRGVEIIDRGLVNFEVDSPGEKLKMVTAGATSYALVKFLFPVRIAFCFALAPFFDKYTVRPIGRLLGMIFKRSKKPNDPNQAKTGN